MELPDGWYQKESKSRPGNFYYVNKITGETTWEQPTEAATPTPKVQVFHILRKHSGSRRPSSWRQQRITQSKEEAIQQIEEFRRELLALQEENPQNEQALLQRFQTIAMVESDCGSHARGGDLGLFGRGEMQKAFEDVSFALAVGEMSDIVDTDSGIHLLLRVH